MLRAATNHDIREKRLLMAIYNTPYMEDEARENFVALFQLPEDILADILESETTTDVNRLKELFNE